MSKPPKHMEIELKLSIAPSDVERLRKLPLLARYTFGQPDSQDMTSTYFDTPELDLMQHGAGLRVRQVNGTAIQTLKSGGSTAGGLHRRNEWESRVAGEQPDPAALRGVAKVDPVLEKLLRSRSIKKRLQPLFTTRVNRTIRVLHLQNGDEVEFALDQGVIEGNGLEAPISEVELELKSGSPAHLFDFARELLDSIPMHVNNTSKAERGYALLATHIQPQKPQVVKASRLRLAHGLTVEQGFQAIVSNCMAHVQGNEAGVLDGSDAESVHQMRVGLRRLRAVLKLFKHVLPCPDEIWQELVWLASQLGEARDWDVLSGSTLPKVVEAASGNAGVEELQQAAVEIAHKKHEQASAAIKSVRYTRLIVSLSGWLLGAGWRESLPASERKNLGASLDKFSRTTLAHDHSSLLKRGKRLRDADAQTRHRVRIAAKKTRYATEFFQSLYPARPVRNYVAALSELQDELGWLNDAAVADGLLGTLQDADSAPADLAGSVGFAKGYLAARADSDAQKLVKRWKQFTHMKLPLAR